MEVWNPELPYQAVDFGLLAAIKSANAPADYKMASIYGHVGGILYTICPVTKYKSGPRKGKDKYIMKDALKVIVTAEQIKEQENKFVQETGRCVKCFGNKLVWSGWHKDQGNSYVPCEKC